MPLGAQRLDSLSEALRPLASHAASAQLSRGRWAGIPAASTYAAGGRAATSVERPADDATARGWTCSGDAEEWMEDEWSRLDVAPRLSDALRGSGHEGAAAILVLCQDGPDLAEPLNEERLGTITGLRPLLGSRLSPGPLRYADPGHPRFDEPTTYYVTGPSAGGAYQVHETRLLRVPGEPMAHDHVRTGHVLPWAGRPRLSQQVLVALRRYQDALRWVPTLIERKQQPVHAAAGLAEQLAAADEQVAVARAAGLPEPTLDAYDVVRARARAVDLTRGTLGTVVVDGDDKFTVLDASLSGLGEAFSVLEKALAAAARMPLSILFGETATGLNATDRGSFESYFGLVGGVQNRQARPALERLTHLLWRQDAFRALEPPRWRVVFNPLWLPSAREQADANKVRSEARKADADALATLADLGVAGPEELREAVRAVIPEWGLSEASPPEPVEVDGPEA